MQTTRRTLLGGALSAAALSAAPKSRFTVGITTNTRGGWENDVWKSFREARELGYRNVESFIHYFVDFWEKPQELKKRVDDIGVTFTTISNGGPMEMHFEDPARHDKLVADHIKLARLLRRLGCDHLKINLGPRRPEGTTADDLKHMATVLNRVGPKISEEGIKLAVHAHMWAQFETRHEIDYIMANTDPNHVYFVLDTGHITLAGINPVELAQTLGHRIREFHLKDTKPEWRGGAKTRLDHPDMMKDPPFFHLGYGGVDFPGIKAVLDKIGWQGYWTVELDSSPFIGPKESSRRSFVYLKERLKLRPEFFAPRA